MGCANKTLNYQQLQPESKDRNASQQWAEFEVGLGKIRHFQEGHLTGLPPMGFAGSNLINNPHGIEGFRVCREGKGKRTILVYCTAF